ncbi:CBS and ACT domain-containing protein [Defluviitalea saccharophila]|uniref:CBS and ACT domain-containing protein n=1 Tax=Defluviitalea saccharophila TaxID=879970 RepID=A0ABZ2Y8E1_9FIRM|nr:CBS domain-containing protein [Candidatus Epulonipiscium sp.]
MYVKNRMNTNVITITEDASISKAFKLMMEHGFSQLPVVRDGILVGLVTEKVLTEVSPSKATSLSVYEINYLLSKTKVKDIMLTEVITVDPDMLIEEAAVLLRSNDIGSLPVVIENNELVGILTRTDLFDAFIEFLGANDHGTRISLEVKDELGTLADIASIIKQYGINIQHVSNYTVKEGQSEIIIRLNTTEVDDLVNSLKNRGYNILSIIKKD